MVKAPGLMFMSYHYCEMIEHQPTNQMCRGRFGRCAVVCGYKVNQGVL